MRLSAGIRRLKSMNGRRPEAGDQENTQFEFLGSDLHHVKAGFDSSEPTEAPEGAQRFPRRRKEQDVPKEPLAERLRRGGGKRPPKG
jgi:hypothetical protein